MKLELLQIQTREPFASMFPRTERLIKKHNIVFTGKEASKYQNDIDFLVCHYFSWHKQACLKYYNDDGQQLVYLISKSEAKLMDNSLVNKLLYKIKKHREKK